MNNGDLKNGAGEHGSGRCEMKVGEEQSTCGDNIQLDDGIREFLAKYPPVCSVNGIELVSAMSSSSSAASSSSQLGSCPPGPQGNSGMGDGNRTANSQFLTLGAESLNDLNYENCKLQNKDPAEIIPNVPSSASSSELPAAGVFNECGIGEAGQLQDRGIVVSGTVLSCCDSPDGSNNPVVTKSTATTERDQVRWPDLSDFTMIQHDPCYPTVEPHGQKPTMKSLICALSSPSTEVPSLVQTVTAPTPLVEVESIRKINYPAPESIEIDVRDDSAQVSDTLVDLRDDGVPDHGFSSPSHVVTTSTPSSPELLKLPPSSKLVVTQSKSAPMAMCSTFVDSNNFNVKAGQGQSVDDGSSFSVTDSKCSTKDIAKVLESFNAILEDNNAFAKVNSIETNSEPELDYDGEDDDCLRMVDTFADLLIGGENDDKDLLIVVDSETESKDKESKRRHRRKSKSVTNIPPINVYEDVRPSTSGGGGAGAAAAVALSINPDSDNDSDQPSSHLNSSDYPDHEDTEGYESDRPMVRASMRKLKPVCMLPPIPSSSIFACASTSHYPILETGASPTHSHNSTSSSACESPVPGPSGSQNMHCVTTQILVSNPNSETGASSSNHGNGSGDLRDLLGDAPQCSYRNEVSNPLYGEVSNSSASSITRNDNGGTRTETSDTIISVPEISSSTPSGSSAEASAANQTSTATNSSTSTSDGLTGTSSSTPVTTNANTRTPTTTTTNTGRSTGRTNAVLGPGLRVPQGKWPHRLSSVLALIGCTVGLNSICRFSLLSVEFGANFVLQFVFLSLIFGIPLFTFHMSMGQYLSSGIIDMWKISPIFQGIGIGLVISQALIGIYTAVGVSWVFIYFRDSFITRYDQYRWGKCVRDCFSTDALNGTSNFSKTVPDYFNTVVLSRSNVDYPKSAAPGGLKFTVAFNLAVAWMLVFVSLSKGLKSYGKVVHGYILVPVAGLLILASKLGGLVPPDQTATLFGQTAWANFFFDSQTWVIAAREAFFTWGILGACVMQITSHNRFTHSLKSDATIVVLVTMFVLLLSAFLGNACYSILASYGYAYVPSSFESNQTYTFLVKRGSGGMNPSLPETSLLSHRISLLMGLRIGKPETLNYAVSSGYQALRLATELFPATMAVLAEHSDMTYFWTILFYFSLIMFGVAQQVAIWYCVIRGVISLKSKVLRYWEITITFCVCFVGFCLGLPFCTELGIFAEYFMDYAVGSAWWIMVLYLLELIAVFIVRGAPYCGENIVTVLISGQGAFTKVMASLVSFIWNVILPVVVLVLSIASFKSGNMRELYNWNPGHGYLFWPALTKEMGSLIQLIPILAVPIVAIIQSCRFLTSGPPDLFERMQQLYRPTTRGRVGRNTSATSVNNNGSDSRSRNREEEATVDPPPKYTPPPSYSTATGAKIARFLRTSIRRSMRRITGGPSTSTVSTINDLPPPPNYATVIMEINAQRQQQQQQQAAAATSGSTLVPIVLTSASDLTDAESGGSSKSRKVYQIPLSRTLGRTLGEAKERGSLRRIASDITPRDIARILRASFRRSNDEARLDDYSSNVTVNTYAPSPHSTASDQNNLNYQQDMTPGRVVESHQGVTTLNIEEDFLRVPSYETAMAMAASASPSASNPHNEDLVTPVQVRVSIPSVFTISDNYGPSSSQCYSIPLSSSSNTDHGRRASGNFNCHVRSSSSGGTLYDSRHRGSSGTTDSQLTLISHSSSQNDLSNYLSNTDFYRVRNSHGVVNPAFLFTETYAQTQDSRNRRPSGASSDA